jgi:hypothetical protein
LQKIENEDFVVSFDEKGRVRVEMKGPGVAATIEPIRVGMIVYGAGHHPYLAHARDCGLLVLDRELLGMEYIGPTLSF